VIEWEQFEDPKDYSKRKPAVFTMSIYMVNQFDALDWKTMKNHMLMESISNEPDVILWAPTCIDFVDNKTMNKIVLCAKDAWTVPGILEAYKDFLKCRQWDNLKPVKDPKQANLIFQKSCLWNTKWINNTW